MGRSSPLSVLLISALLLISFSHVLGMVMSQEYLKGLGRKLMQSFGNEGDAAVPSEENAGLSRLLIEGDYGYGNGANAVANSNAYGYGCCSPPPPDPVS